jgi:hypothetical protein
MLHSVKSQREKQYSSSTRPIESIITRSTTIAAHALYARLTKALPGMGIASLIFTSIYVARTLRASFFRVDVPICALAPVTCAADDMRATFTLAGFWIAGAIFRAAYVTVTAYKETKIKEKSLNDFRLFEFCFRKSLWISLAYKSAEMSH